MNESSYPAYYKKNMLDSYKNVFGWRRWFLGAYWKEVTTAVTPKVPEIDFSADLSEEEDDSVFLLAVKPQAGKKSSFLKALASFLESQGIEMEYSEMESDK